MLHPSSRGPRRIDPAATLAAVGVLLVCALAATSPLPWGRGAEPRKRQERTPDGFSTASPLPAPTKDPDRVVSGLSALMTVLVTVVWVVAAVAVVASLVLLVRRLVRLARHTEAPRRQEAAEDVFSVRAPAEEGIDADDLGRHVETSLARLGDDEVAASIIASWQGLEELAARSGVHRAATATTSEFAARVVAGTGVDPAPVADLAALYREVVHSTHEPGPAQRDRAVADLEAVRTALANGVGLG